ncbi:hypothetical protein TTHERM_00193450 (macronuclear) [Tetrahymena thermophila SB210]|uniref:Uncharacterized protein n=1 Tax=Tetrahymena thermophila (strain SB210) TaxID=312017 RepID=Q23KJ0_TETTS|nr:hypothetical protein TTHERM_00193450 [Tetrahymena thermophila SB210]EAR96853.4 hypothetical protein TTHERM_00193450 [Tetrahymena thermophila SB210]|eukprot:XP_001017098.4 hypothetical protein TTHERM_00193450 [Tetrahymena thermophila SB210]
MNKRKGSLYEQLSRVTPMLKNSGQTVTEKYEKDKEEHESWHHIQPNSQLNSFQHHQRLEQIQKPHQFKLKENINTFNAAQSQNQHKLQQTSKQAKQIRSHSAQRSSSLDKRRQEVCYWDKNCFIENTDLHQNNNHNNLDQYRNHPRGVNQHSINDKIKRQVQCQTAFNMNYNLINNDNQHSLKIEKLRDEYNREQGRDLQIQESLANQMENSTHYQEEFEYTVPNTNERNEYMNEEEGYILSINQHARTQYRKPQAKNINYQKQTFDYIKQLIQKQQKDMKYYLEQRTTDTTDDQNVSINPNNKSSSDEAILTSADQKSFYDQCGNENHINGNYIASHFPYPKNGKQYSKAFIAKEISSSHDTTKLIDDESGNKQQNSDNNIKANFESTCNQKDYQEYLSEQHIYSKNQFNNTHPSANNKMPDLILFEKPNQIRSSCNNRYELRRKNTPSQGSNQKNNKKTLSIISDQFEDMLECKMVDHQLCPKSEIKKNNLYSNPNKIQKRSKSETKNSRNYR